jgi:hypothetical protein
MEDCCHVRDRLRAIDRGGSGTVMAQAGVALDFRVKWIAAALTISQM